jgi:hypothetical protein
VRLAGTALAFLLLCAGAADAACLKAGGEDQAIEGKLASVRITIPDYKRSEQVFMLQLAAEACLDVEEKDDEVDPTRRIHVFGGDDVMNKRMRGLVGKAVRIRGEPFGQHTVHHHAPIVMRVTAIEALK